MEMRKVFTRGQSSVDVIYIMRGTEPTTIKEMGSQTIKESREAAEEGEERTLLCA